MRFMIIRKADADTEAGVMPSAELLGAMGAYNARLVEAGVMQAGEGLHPSSKGARVAIGDEEPTVTGGPFAEAEELVAGFTMIQVDSLAEAIEWVKQWPKEDGPVELEIRQVFEIEDFGDEFRPDMRAAEERMREQIKNTN